MTEYFSDYLSLETYLLNSEKGFILIGYDNIAEYDGMVLYKAMRFEKATSSYRLELEWMSLGLDLYGDTLQESYHYRFHSLKELIEYLNLKYKLNIYNIPVKYSFDSDLFPNPIKNGDQKSFYEVAWEKFLKDFSNENFLDKKLTLVYSSSWRK